MRLQDSTRCPVNPRLATSARRHWVAALPMLAGLAAGLPVLAPAAQAAVDAAALPEPKRSRAALYLEVRDVPAFPGATSSTRPACAFRAERAAG